MLDNRNAYVDCHRNCQSSLKNVVEMRPIPCRFFSRNLQRPGIIKPIQKRRSEDSRRSVAKTSFLPPLLAHAPYTMNLASDKEKVYEFACTVIREDKLQ